MLPLMEAFYTIQGEGYHSGKSSRVKLGKNARKKVIESYSWGAEEKKINNIYNNLND